MKKILIYHLLSFLFMGVVSFSNNAGKTGPSLELIHDQLQRIKYNYSNLILSGQLQFNTSQAQALYYRSLQDMERQINNLSDLIGGGNPGYENYRGRAVAFIQKSVNFAYQSAAVKSLPKFVSEGDLAAVQFIVQEVAVVHLVNILKAYFKNTLDRPKLGNFKHTSAIEIMNNVSIIFHLDCLNALPAYISYDDHIAVKGIVDHSLPPRIAAALRDYFNTI